MHHSPIDSLPPRRIAGGLLLANAVLAVLAMAHHPHAHGGPDPLAAMARIAGVAALVHGIMLVLLVAMVVLLGEFATSRVRQASLARAGKGLFMFGGFGLVLAALINGFAVPATATAAAGASPGVEWAPVLRFAWQLNQAAAGFGVLAWAAGTIVWSADLVRRRGGCRWLGAYGLLAGAVIAVGVASHSVQLDVRGFGTVLFALALWQAGAGLLLARRENT